MRNALFVLGGVLMIAALIALAYWYVPTSTVQPVAGDAEGGSRLIDTVSYLCDSGRTIEAQYYEPMVPPPSNPNGPPLPGGYVKLTLGDGQSLTLTQTLSADGARYDNSGDSPNGKETFVFWSRGNGAFVLDNGTQSYTGCIALAKDPGALPQAYASSSRGFSVRYPADYTAHDLYTDRARGQDSTIFGVQFTIPDALATGTNLATDSYVSVEQQPDATTCTATVFLSAQASTTILTENGTTYSFASSTGAAAGNRYEEYVYALPGTTPCTAMRYHIHYGVFENYPSGSIQPFDRQSLLATFDSVRHTLLLTP